MENYEVRIGKATHYITTARGRLATGFNYSKSMPMIIHKENGHKQNHTKVILKTSAFHLNATAKFNENNPNNSPLLILTGNMNLLKNNLTIKEKEIETLPEELWFKLQNLFLSKDHPNAQTLKIKKEEAMFLLASIHRLNLGKKGTIEQIQTSIAATKGIKGNPLQSAIAYTAWLAKETHDQLTMGGQS